MIDWLVDPFVSNTFMQRALVAGVLVAVACGVIGTFVVLRGLAFIGDALAHGVLPGVAAALLLGIPGVVGAMVGAIAMIAGIGWITGRSRLSTDTAIGLLFVGMLALGVVIVSRTNRFTGELVEILFGDVLGVNTAEIWTQAVATVAVAVIAVVCARPFLLLSVSPEQADVSGFSSRWYHLVMLTLIALTVVVSFQTVGTLLVFGMLLAPAGAAALVAKRVTSMIVLAAALGVVSVYTGLLVSFHWDIPGGAAIVLCAVVLFFVILVVQSARTTMRARAGSTSGLGL